MTDADLAFADVTTLGRLLRRRAVSSVELTRLALARLERHGPSLGALAALVPERALRDARRADRELAAGRDRGPLHGIPYGAKDMLDAAGAPTTWGAQPLRERRVEADAAAIERLTAAGAVLAAKLAMVELAGGFFYGAADAAWTGPGRTPWDLAYWSGGSSSGSGAAVAAGLVPFAIGSETCGSILHPSASCGVSGLRPTFGRVSRRGAMALCWTLDKLGPMARTAAGCDAVLRALAGADSGDPSSREMPWPAARRRPRIGVAARATAKTMPAVRASFEASLEVLATFCDVDDAVAVPDMPYEAAVTVVIAAEGASALRDFVDAGHAAELRDAGSRLGAHAGRETLAIDYIDAQRRRRQMTAALAAAFGGYDAIAAPTLPTVAWPIGVPFDAAYPRFKGAVDLISAGNLAGLPALSVPNGFGPRGLPTGLSLLGRPFGEAALAAIGAAYQRRTRFHLERPPRFADGGAIG